MLMRYKKWYEFTTYYYLLLSYSNNTNKTPLPKCMILSNREEISKWGTIQPWSSLISTAHTNRYFFYKYTMTHIPGYA